MEEIKPVCQVLGHGWSIFGHVSLLSNFLADFPNSEVLASNSLNNERNTGIIWY